MRHRVARLALVTLIGFSTASAAAAGPRTDHAVAGNWKARLETIDGHLERQEWTRARKMADNLLREMCDQIESGDGAAGFLALASLFRGVARAGLGDARDALWDVQIAAALHPSFRDVDLNRYGAAVSANLTAEPRVYPPFGLILGLVEAPVVLESPNPKYPGAQRVACLEAPVVVAAFIGPDGVPHHPRLLTPSQPVLGFAALDSLRDWRFAPARLDGEPIAVDYTLSVQFEIPACRDPLAQFRRAQRAKGDG